jgi:hypothetical protein
LPPPEDLKDDLMREGFESIKSLADNDDRALLAFYLIQYLHPYADGNGRTGRLLYKIISEDGKNIDDNEMYALLNHDSNSSVEHGAGRDVFANEVLDAQKASYYINRELAKDVLGDDFVKNNGEIYLTASLGYSFIPERERSLMSEPDIKLVESILQENGTVAFPFNGLVLTKVLQQNNLLQRYGYNLMIKTGPERGASILPEDSGKNIFGIYAEDFMDDLDSTTINQLINTHRSLKVKSIETLIDIFVHPDKHQVMGPDGNQVPIKDIFDTELKKQLGL